MKTIKNYNIYIFITTFMRNIIDVYSVIYFYELGYSIKDIIAIYASVYFMGAFISTFGIVIGNKIGYKYILMVSNIFSAVTFYLINMSFNMYLIIISLSVSIFTYHPVRHYYGIKLLKNKKDIGNNLIFSYIAIFLSSYMAIIGINFVNLIIVSLIGIIPAFFIKHEEDDMINYHNKIEKNKLHFFIFDQFKIIFILLEPLYLYLLASNISYVGLFNIVLTISSIICIYFLSRKIDIYKNYKYINIIFTLVLLLKLNINSKTFLLFIAFMEGIGRKCNELISTINLYHGDYANPTYLIKSEIFISMVRALILSIIYFLSINLKTILYILLLGIFILSFQFKKNT